MNSRQAILDRVREALVRPAPFPGTSDRHDMRTDLATHPTRRIREWLPEVGPTFAERLALFRNNSSHLRCDLLTFDSLDALQYALVAQSVAWRQIATHRGEITDLVCKAIRLPTCLTDDGYNTLDLEKCDVGITQCDALIAQTGSILVTSRSAGGRALSVLPPHHIVLARHSQLIADLPEAFALLEQRYSPKYPSFTSFITGPSRTGDIERTIVLGAHGPKQLTICLLCEPHVALADEFN